ncbi:MAG: hypothetical protein NTW79_04415 [Candidatus Berkelbacteria bacterium]|nr:hypothetical protein [Candidatus Berkelbacteria bacterium]
MATSPAPVSAHLSKYHRRLSENNSIVFIKLATEPKSAVAEVPVVLCWHTTLAQHSAENLGAYAETHLLTDPPKLSASKPSCPLRTSAGRKSGADLGDSANLFRSGAPARLWLIAISAIQTTSPATFNVWRAFRIQTVIFLLL